MKHKFLETSEQYDGAQLASLRNYLKHHLLGDSVVAWVGPCDVHVDHMVDGEDLLAHARICGSEMLHFIVETFDTSLFAAVGLQRLLASLVKDELQVLARNKDLARSLTRDGDDIYAGTRKLSISIATQSPVSSLIHFAVNVVNKGTPVETLALEDLQVDAKSFAEAVMERFTTECESIRQATQKVRWVK
ncbi:MAG: DUF366 family protein [Bdellovibrionales bacterium]|nr:DUF366 family protein [Bdellovibrionales bacterium]